MQGAHDIAFLAHPAQGVFEIEVKPPHAASLLGREAHAPERLQSPGAQALFEAVAMRRPDEAVGIDRIDEALVDAGKALLLDLALAGAQHLVR